MKQSRLTIIPILICVVVLCVVAIAGQNQFGVANSYQVNFSEKVWVGDTLLPAGDYEIRHVIDGQNHIMVFRQLRVRKPAEVRAPCTLVSLPEKSGDSRKTYALNAANERVLHELIFKGDGAKHVF